MRLRAGFRGRLVWSLGTALVAAGVLAAPAGAMSSGGALSPRLAELAKPAVRAESPTKQAATLSVAPSGPGSLLREGNRVLADVRLDQGTSASLKALRAAGARIVTTSRRYQTVTVAVTPASLHSVAAVPGVRGVIEDLAPIVSAIGAACPSGATVSEGDTQLHAAEARSDFEVDGKGVTVGVLSDSFDQSSEAATNAAHDIESGDLPGPGNPCGQTTPVDVLEEYEPGGEATQSPTDEGRAMAQIVHDLAPGASLDFATAFNGELGFAENIRRLWGSGAKVIADDATYLDEPFFQDGPVADAIDEVTAQGADYFTAAGNNNLIDEGGNDIGSWEAPEFRDSGGCPPGVPAYATQCMNFDPGGNDRTFGITVEPGATLTVDLQWAQPWNGVKTDLDAYLLKGTSMVAESEYPNTDPAVQEPVEVLSWPNHGKSPATVDLAINRCEATCGVARAAAHPKELKGTTGGDSGTPRLKFALLENGEGVTATEYPTSSEGDVVGPTIFGHSGASAAVTVGAVPFDNSSMPEDYSSRGPVTHYFGPVTGTSPAKPLSSPEEISKPDVVATDCGATTFFAFQEEGVWRFCGTSAAAPHAAAVAALMLQANPSLNPTQVRSALTATARPVGAFGADAVGAGLVNAFGAVSQIALPPTITVTQPPPAISRIRSPAIAFTADRPVNFSCSIDGGSPQPCGSPFAPSAPLADGRHSFTVSGTDIAGRVGSSTVSFIVDTTPPKTFFIGHPHKLIRTRARKARVTFRFGSNEAGATFICGVSGGLLRLCGRRFSHWFGVGKHFVLVKARDAAGNIDRTPAIFRFRVERIG